MKESKRFDASKIGYILFCAVFFAICIFFSLGLPIPGADVGADDAGEMPVISGEDGINQDFGSEFETWFSKSFAFRSVVVDAYSQLRLGLFSEGNSQVTVGKDGFLFFADTLADFTRTSPMTDEEIEASAEALALISAQSEAAGAKFLFVCAPNKNTVYGDMMPDRFRIGRTDVPSNLDRFYEALDARGVEYLDLRPVLSEASESALVYHKRDTHWNGAGALAAFEAIAERLSFDVCDLSGRGPVIADDFVGDLDELLFPGRVMYDENVTYDFEGLYVFTSAYSSEMDMVITTRGGGEGKALIFRDSFANALIPYAAASFSEVRFDRATPYNISAAESFGADCVIVEIAERNLRCLADYAEADDAVGE